MLEEIIQKVISAMTPHLDPEQLEHLGNVLYVNYPSPKGNGLVTA